MSHTPGPWQQNGSHIYGPDTNGRRVICQVSYFGGIRKGEDRANEALLIASPDLLAACKEALENQYEKTALDEDLVKTLEAAIAKAEGRS